jgi:ABC-2 type transport system permease protein
MIEDLRTVAWKETREIVARRSETKRGLSYRTLVLPILIGIFFGLQTMRGSNGLAVFPVGLLAMSTTTGLITDAVAGERERHTLETLLASPVSDLAILGGKLAAVVGYAWVLALVQLAAIEATSIVVGHALSPVLVVTVAILSLLEAVLAAGFGVQFSMHAPNVRAAARKLGQLAFLLILPVSFLNVFAVSEPGGTLYTVLLVAAVAGLLAADAALLALAKARFRRGQLLLD